jgi:hypothetical protein
MISSKVFDIDLATGEQILRDLTVEELEVQKADLASKQKELDALLVKAQERADLLSKLNITEDEAKLLLG